MKESGIYVQNVQALEQLDQRMSSSAEAMSDVDKNVNNHLNDVRNTLESQLNIIQQRLDEAEARLQRAQACLRACLASQCVNEYGIVTPSCICEERDVAEAQCEVDKWRGRYERGQQILSECQQEISDYSAGGHSLIMKMGEQQREASSQLCECIGKLYEILEHDVVLHSDVENVQKGK